MAGQDIHSLRRRRRKTHLRAIHRHDRPFGRRPAGGGREARRGRERADAQFAGQRARHVRHLARGLPVRADQLQFQGAAALLSARRYQAFGARHRPVLSRNPHRGSGRLSAAPCHPHAETGRSRPYRRGVPARIQQRSPARFRHALRARDQGAAGLARSVRSRQHLLHVRHDRPVQGRAAEFPLDQPVHILPARLRERG